jgi:signal transduction histidine kinase
MDTAARLESIFPGNSEMARLMRAFDWSTSEVGIPEQWPESLKAAVRICVSSRNPIVIWWGKKALTQIYNDGYMRILTAAKHPQWLGRSGAECWSEIMETMGPLWEQVLNTGEATWFEDFLYIMNRNLPREECYFTFSYSALRNDSGIVDGILCICYETTSRVLGDGRLRTLRDLGRTVAAAKTPEAACKTAADILGANPGDIPFSLLYLLDDDAKQARLVAASGFARDDVAGPDKIDLTSPVDGSGWPLKRVLDSGSAELVSELSSRFGQLPGGLWPECPENALIVPITSAGQSRGFLVAGCGPRRILDADYRSFFDLVAGHVSTAVANATAYEEERKRAEALAELDRAKTTFFSNISHEFRTPLTLMLGPLEDALAGNELSPQAQEQVQVAHRNSLRLLKLVNSLLDFSRIEAGRIQATYEPVDLASYTADLASVFRSAIERAGMKLVVDCAPVAQLVYVDREMWEKIVLNLLSNAFKFTFAGEIKVAVRRAGDMVELVVADTGTGIPRDELPHIFERFHRVKGARGRSMEGSGIGLALVQELVKLHGGTVSVESEIDGGSTFLVRIPLGTPHLPANRIETAHPLASTRLHGEVYVDEALRWLPEMQSSVAGDETYLAEGADIPPELAQTASRELLPRILLADDNADMREYVKRLLSRRYEVEAVSDGLQALQAARERTPDLVLTDIMMPKMDGFELLKQLRADPRLKTVPVILLSARAGGEASVEGLKSGADDYLTKPFSARELVARVDAHLKMARLRADALTELEQAFQALRRSEQRQAMLAAELQHRVRNILAIVHTITARTAQGARSVQDYADLMAGRLMALGRTQELLTRSNEGVDLASMIVNELSAKAREEEYEIEGPQVAISPRAAEVLGLAVHELATNALKYGALSEEGGRVRISWHVAPRDSQPWLQVDWAEKRAHPLAKPERSRRGFGTELIERRIPYELHGLSQVAIDQNGAQCRIEFPLQDGASILETKAPALRSSSG